MTENRNITLHTYWLHGLKHQKIRFRSPVNQIFFFFIQTTHSVLGQIQQYLLLGVALPVCSLSTAPQVQLGLWLDKNLKLFGFVKYEKRQTIPCQSNKQIKKNMRCCTTNMSRLYLDYWRDKLSGKLSHLWTQKCQSSQAL